VRLIRTDTPKRRTPSSRRNFVLTLRNQGLRAARVVLELVTELNESDSAALDTHNEDVVKSNDERRRQEIAQQAHLARDIANTTVGVMAWKSNKRPGDGNISSSLIKKISHKDHDMLSSWALTEGGAA
jgi:hypothetical protein